MNEYIDQALTINDLLNDERGSTFTNCSFESAEEAGIEGVNFSFGFFIGCAWNVECRECNFKGAEGDSLPPLTLVAFDSPPEASVCVRDENGTLVKGDGSTAEFAVSRLDVEALESLLSESGLPSFTVTPGNVDITCAIGPAVMTRQEYIDQPVLKITTDAVDTADPIDGLPDIPADGVSSCTITICKVSRVGVLQDAPEDNETIDLECTRGMLTALRIDLVNGEASVNLVSVPETVVSEIKAKADGVGEASIQIQFAPPVT